MTQPRQVIEDTDALGCPLALAPPERCRTWNVIGPLKARRPVIAQVLDNASRHAERAGPTRLQASEELAVTGRQETHTPESDSTRTSKELRQIDE